MAATPDAKKFSAGKSAFKTSGKKFLHQIRRGDEADDALRHPATCRQKRSWQRSPYRLTESQPRRRRRETSLRRAGRRVTFNSGAARPPSVHLERPGFARPCAADSIVSGARPRPASTTDRRRREARARPAEEPEATRDDRPCERLLEKMLDKKADGRSLVPRGRGCEPVGIPKGAGIVGLGHRLIRTDRNVIPNNRLARRSGAYPSPNAGRDLSYGIARPFPTTFPRRKPWTVVVSPA
jgi:hypothetical protein